MRKKFVHTDQIRRFAAVLSRVDPKHEPALAGDLDDYLWQVGELTDLLTSFRNATSRTPRQLQCLRLREIDRISDYLPSVIEDVRKAVAKLRNLGPYRLPPNDFGVQRRATQAAERSEPGAFERVRCNDGLDDGAPNGEPGTAHRRRASKAASCFAAYAAG